MASKLWRGETPPLAGKARLTPPELPGCSSGEPWLDSPAAPQALVPIGRTDSACGEEVAQQRTALLLEDPAAYVHPMVEPRVPDDVEQ